MLLKPCQDEGGNNKDKSEDGGFSSLSDGLMCSVTGIRNNSLLLDKLQF